MRYLFVVSGWLGLVVLGGCPSKEDARAGKGGAAASRQLSGSQRSGGAAVTAKQAWKVVKQAADKWSDSYQIAHIRQVSGHNTQCIDGLADGWKFQLEVCPKKNAVGTCVDAMSRSYQFHTKKRVGDKRAGLTATQPRKIASGRSPFSPARWKIDSDRAQDIARQAVGAERNDNEEFQMEMKSNGEFPYWRVGRRCWFKGDRKACSRADNYGIYVNAETGETYERRP
jgi:hypothetical protein